MAYSVHIENLHWEDVRGIVQMVALHEGAVVIRDIKNGIADIVCEFGEIALAGIFFEDVQELLAIARSRRAENAAMPLEANTRENSELTTLYREIIKLFEADVTPKSALHA